MTTTPIHHSARAGDWSLFVPKLVTVFQEGYSRAAFRADLFAGLTVAIVAMPLSMALAIASGVGPERGLFTAVVAGALIAIFGGVGTVAGPIVGAAVLVPISEYSRVWFSGSGRNVDLLIYGFLIMVLSVYRPNGVISLLELPAIRQRLGRFSLGKPQSTTWTSPPSAAKEIT